MKYKKAQNDKVELVLSDQSSHYWKLKVQGVSTIFYHAQLWSSCVQALPEFFGIRKFQ